jgi:hypothetical protein
MEVPEKVRNLWPGRKKESWYSRAGHAVGRTRNLALAAGLLAVLGGAWGGAARALARVTARAYPCGAPGR